MNTRENILAHLVGMYLAQLVSILFHLPPLDGKSYYGMNYKNDGTFANLVIQNDMSWNLIVPIDSLDRQTFGQCMQMHWNGCRSSWTCGLSCGLTIDACAAGMGLPSSGRLACPNCY